MRQSWYPGLFDPSPTTTALGLGINHLSLDATPAQRSSASSRLQDLYSAPSGLCLFSTVASIAGADPCLINCLTTVVGVAAEVGVVDGAIEAEDAVAEVEALMIAVAAEVVAVVTSTIKAVQVVKEPAAAGVSTIAVVEASVDKEELEEEEEAASEDVVDVQLLLGDLWPSGKYFCPEVKGDCTNKQPASVERLPFRLTIPMLINLRTRSSRSKEPTSRT